MTYINENKILLHLGEFKNSSGDYNIIRVSKLSGDIFKEGFLEHKKNFCKKGNAKHNKK